MRRVRRRIFQLAEESRDWARKGLQGNVAHDHSSKLISAKKLNQPLTIKVPFYDEDEDGPKPNGPEYTLEIQYSRDIDTQGLLKYVIKHLQHVFPPLFESIVTLKDSLSTEDMIFCL